MKKCLLALCALLLLASCATTGTRSGVERIYVLYCGEGTAPDQSRWSPGVNAGKQIGRAHV